MKNLAILIITYLSFTANSFAAFSSNPDSTDTKEEFSTNQYGLGLSVAKEFNVIKGIFSEDENDHIFNEVGIFYNYYGDEIDQNYGANISFGYGYKKTNIYFSGGYVVTDFDHKINGTTNSYNRGTGFVGAGTSYKITDHLKAKLDFMNYSFNFQPINGGAIEKTDINVRSLALGLQLYF